MTKPISQSVNTFKLTTACQKKTLHRKPGYSQKQKGAALFISLMLLLIVTLIALGSISGTTLQEKMVSNMYDREIGFQSSEAALRIAEAALTLNNAIGDDCAPSGSNCRATPLAGANWTSIAAGVYDAALLSAGAPQYIIEQMGNWPDPNPKINYSNFANRLSYGTGGGLDGGEWGGSVRFQRVTSRSHDPDTDNNNVVNANDSSRAVVTLQTWIKD